MGIRSAVVASVIAVCSIFITAPPGTAAGGELSLVFDTWVPRAGDCQQKITFRVMQLQSGDAPAPTGTVRLLSDSGASLGSVSVQGFGEYEVSGACGAAEGAHRVGLAYDGDAQYAASRAWSPDSCPRDPETLSPDAWQVLAAAGDPQPAFICHTNTGGFSIRSLDGRLYTGGGSVAMYPTPWSYGEQASISVDVEGDSDRQPTPPTGSVVASLDGVAQRTFVSDGTVTAYDWNVDTSRALPGEHSLKVTYSGDRRWAPETVVSRKFTIVRARPTGAYSVKRWHLSPGQHPVVSVKFRNTWSRKAKAPTGKVSFYLGKHHVGDATLRRSDGGRREVTLPAVRGNGTKLLRVVYRGDARYKSLDSTGRHWYGSQQYIQVG